MSKTNKRKPETLRTDCQVPLIFTSSHLEHVAYYIYGGAGDLQRYAWLPT